MIIPVGTHLLLEYLLLPLKEVIGILKVEE